MTYQMIIVNAYLLTWNNSYNNIINTCKPIEAIRYNTISDIW